MREKSKRQFAHRGFTTATIRLGLAAATGAVTTIGCADSGAPPYFGQQPSYSDPDRMDRPGYYDARPDYRYTPDPDAPPPVPPAHR